MLMDDDPVVISPERQIMRFALASMIAPLALGGVPPTMPPKRAPEEPQDLNPWVFLVIGLLAALVILGFVLAAYHNYL